MEYLSSRLGVSIKQFDAKGTEAKTRSLTDLFWVFNVAYFILRIFTEIFLFFQFGHPSKPFYFKARV